LAARLAALDHVNRRTTSPADDPGRQHTLQDRLSALASASQYASEARTALSESKSAPLPAAPGQTPAPPHAQAHPQPSGHRHVNIKPDKLVDRDRIGASIVAECCHKHCLKSVSVDDILSHREITRHQKATELLGKLFNYV